jgi:hypothetical protein
VGWRAGFLRPRGKKENFVAAAEQYFSPEVPLPHI